MFVCGLVAQSSVISQPAISESPSTGRRCAILPGTTWAGGWPALSLARWPEGPPRDTGLGALICTRTLLFSTCCLTQFTRRLLSDPVCPCRVSPPIVTYRQKWSSDRLTVGSCYVPWSSSSPPALLMCRPPRQLSVFPASVCCLPRKQNGDRYPHTHCREHGYVLTCTTHASLFTGTVESVQRPWLECLT